jgi:hypothetical protein
MNSSASYQINITLHIFILFTFLTIFFFTFLSKVETENINNVTKDLIKSQTSTILSNINSNIPNLTPPSIIKDKIDLNKLADNLENSSKKDIPELNNNNNKLLYISIGIIIFIFFIFIGLIIYYKVYKKQDIGFKHILLENIIIFSFAGLIEYLFFMYVAVKYIPITPDVLTGSILDNIEDKFNDVLIK